MASIKERKKAKKATNEASSSNDKKQWIGRSIQVTWSQKEAMLSWMSIEANFNLYVGRATANLKGVVAGKKLKKETAYPMLAAHVNQMCSSGLRKMRNQDGDLSTIVTRILKFNYKFKLFINH